MKNVKSCRLNNSKSSHFVNGSGQQPCSLGVGAAAGVAIVFGGGGSIRGGNGGRLLDVDDDDDCEGGDTKFRTSDECDDDVFNLDPTGDANASSPSLSDGP
jgi:hypothetical protein